MYYKISKLVRTTLDGYDENTSRQSWQEAVYFVVSHGVVGNHILLPPTPMLVKVPLLYFFINPSPLFSYNFFSFSRLKAAARMEMSRHGTPLDHDLRAEYGGLVGEILGKELVVWK